MQARPVLPPEPNKSLCPKCSAQKPPNETNCTNCGARACLRCTNILSPASRICPACGWEDRKWKPQPRSYVAGIKTPTVSPVPGEVIGFLCPNCKVKISPESGHCSNCGYLIDTYQDTTAGDSTAPETRFTPPLQKPSQQLVTHEPIPSKFDVEFGHSCPHCGQKVTPGSDRCPNCGHIGPMQHDMESRHGSTISPKTGFVPQVKPQSTVPQQLQPIPEVAQGRSCPQCGQNISPDSRICPYCNANVGSRRPAPPLHAISTTERAQGNVLHPVASVPARPTVPSPVYRGESASPKVVSVPLPGIPADDKSTREKPKERAYKEKRRAFPIGLLAAIIVVAAALIGMVIYVASQEFKPPVSSPADDNAFNVESITAKSITETSVVVTWITDIPATSQVQLCKGDILCLPWTDIDNELTTSHSVTVTGLEQGTLYHVTVRSLDADENEVISDQDVIFTTLGDSGTIAFSISGVNVINIKDTSATIKWTTNKEATSKVEYGKTTSYGTQSLDNNFLKNHSITLSNLEIETDYYYKITCIDADGNETVYESTQAFTTSVQITVGINIGNRAPDFTLNQLGGGTTSLSDLRGKIVMVNFWYTTCGPCIAEMPDIEEVYTTWSDQKQLVVLAVNRGDDSTTIQDFVNTHELTFPVLLDSDQSINSKYLVTAWPTTYFIDADGIIQDYKEGNFTNKDEILAKLESVK